MGQPFGDFLGNVFDVEDAALVDTLGQRCVPSDASEQLDVAHRRDERALVFRRKRAIDPIEKTGKRDAGVLPRIADRDAGRRPRNRDQSRGDGAALGSKTVDDGERAPVSAQDENARLLAQLENQIGARARLRYSCRLRGGPAVLARASTRAAAVSRLVKHAIPASTAARRIL